MSGSGISIHAPREGCDVASWSPRRARIYFNPRTPRGVRHLTRDAAEAALSISIHAPREGCDAFSIVL